MLKFLSIRDFVIVSALELDFSAGFTALTGETGAGQIDTDRCIDACAWRAMRCGHGAQRLRARRDRGRV